MIDIREHYESKEENLDDILLLAEVCMTYQCALPLRFNVPVMIVSYIVCLLGLAVCTLCGG